MEDDFLPEVTSYTPEVGDRICERIIRGEALSLICHGCGMPTLRQCYAWMVKHPEFEAMFWSAMRIKMDIWADEIIKIADEAKNDWFTDKDGVRRVNQEAVKRSEIRIKTRQWLMERFSKKVYAPPVALALAAQGGGSRIVVNVITNEMPTVEAEIDAIPECGDDAKH